ncbi:MAG: RDD family protein, partial [Acidobacteriota bacterium]|nr:RDD family protein [Acidobacteriota bacterium]
MKCPKCGYLGFETTDRCRNCQYDFSLSPFSTEPDLALRPDPASESSGDFELPAIKRQTDNLAAGALDLDRLFGDAESGTAVASEPRSGALEPSAPSLMSLAEPHARAEPEHEPPDVPADPNALPFDDAPLLPRAARTPLAVRRATPEIPRNRPRTTRPVRMEAPLAFEPAPAPPTSAEVSALAAETVASLMQAPTLAARVGAGVIDLALLAAVDAAVLFLTLRISGLQTTIEDLRVIPVVPFAAFLALLAFGYVAAFTVAGGQTIGKMLLGLRVIGDDGRPIDAAGGVLRAVGCMLVPATLGLSYVPAFFSSDHRALHDR